MPPQTVSRRREAPLADLTGLAAADAIDQLRALELRPAVEPCEVELVSQHGVVVAHDPPEGRPIRRAQVVTLLVGQARASVSQTDAHAPAAGADPRCSPCAVSVAPLAPARLRVAVPA